MRTYRTEADLESACTELAKLRGYQHRKLDVGHGAKNQLDHAYWGPNGDHFIVEFKLPGESPTKGQRIRIDRLRRMGHRVYVLDSFEDFAALMPRR